MEAQQGRQWTWLPTCACPSTRCETAPPRRLPSVVRAIEGIIVDDRDTIPRHVTAQVLACRFSCRIDL